nr:hypothetical protein [Tanacetum cinerariifolium]
MIRDVITVGLTMRIPLLYRVSLAGNAQNAHPTLKDLNFWTAEKKKIRKIDHLERSLLIQGLPNDIYSLINSNKTAKDLWDAFERRMRGFEYGEQDRKAAILYKYETFKAIKGEQLLDTYLRHLQVINYLKKCGYKKDNCELNYQFLNNLQPEWKQYGTLMRQTKNLMDINIDALYNILKQNQGDVNDALGYKKKAVVVTSDPLALVAEKTKVSKQKEKVVLSSDSKGSGVDDFSELKKITALLANAFNRRKFYSKPTNNNLRTSSTSQSANKKQEFVKSDDKKEDKKDDEKKRDMSKVKCYNCKKEGHFAKDCKKAKIKDYNYYKTKMLLAKKDSDEQVLLAEDQAWMESSSDSNQEINANMVFMAQIEKVLSESDESSSSAEETIAEVSYYTSESESESEFETSEYYDNSTNYGLLVNDNDDQEIFHDAIESASENFIENHIDSQKDYDKSEVDHNDSEEKEHLVDKLIRKFNHKIVKCHKRIEKANQQSKYLENQNKDLQEKYDVLLNQSSGSLDFEVLIVGYEHVVMNCGSAGNRISNMTKALLIPKYQDYQTQHVLIIGTSQSRQHDKSEPTTCQMEEPPHPVFEIGADDQPIVQISQHPEWFSQPRRPPSPDRDWNKTLPAAQGDAQSWISDLARQTDARSSFNELLDTPIDFSNFIMNRLNVDTLTPALLAGPTYELMRGLCTSLTELEYHLEEVYKATTDQLDWVNPEGQQYPHNLLQPLPLIPDNRGRRVIPFEHFINNDLEYLWGSTSSQGDFKRLRLQDIEDMMLLLVQGKLSNLTVEEHFAFNVSLRMFTRSIVIQRRVEDLQLGVESYQKRLNLTKPDKYRTDLRRREAYTAYSNPRGFIYQNKDKKNKLMRIDELHKFSDGTLNDVRNALDDHLKGIRMQYLPTTIWRRGDKDRAAVMIQVIDKMLKTRRIMRSLEKFVGGQLYEGDFRMLQKTI